MNSPFRCTLANDGKVYSDIHEDFDGKVPVFSAHSKVDLSGNVVYFAKGPRSRDAKQSAIIIMVQLVLKVGVTYRKL